MNNVFIQICNALIRFYYSPARRMLIGAYLVAVIGGLSGTLWQKEVTQKSLIADINSSSEVASGLGEEAIQAKMQLIELQSINDKLYDEYLIASASAKATNLALAKAIAVPPVAKVPESNSLPGDGYSRQTVSTSRGSFVISLVVATGAKVVVDTASDSDCVDNCPVIPLADYVTRNNAFAGINASYFCPPDYPRCQGMVNSYDTLAFNGRTKTAFNQNNNVYSVVPLMAAYGVKLSFYRRTLDWGVDQSSTGAIANHPLLLQGGNIAFEEGSLEAYQRDGRGTKGFIGTRGDEIIIGHIFGATVPEEAEVLKTLGLENALNLDGGGSSALWYGGYKIGPGRALPNAILLVK
ncbi:MAG: phosphodiester glycosidase family protein [bacterium]